MIRADDNTIKVTIGRLGNDPQEYTVPEDSTIEQAFQAAGLRLASNEKIFVNGDKATPRDILEDGDTVSVITPKEAGNY